MGILKTIGLQRYRKEAASFVDEYYVNKNDPPDFIPDLIRNKYTNIEDLSHLEIVAQRDPIATYIVYKLSENTFDDWFRFTDDNGNEIMTEVQKELKLLGAKRSLTLALANERWAGYSYLYTGKNRFIPKTKEGGRIASLQPFTPKECVVFEYNEIGEPKTMEIVIEVGKQQYKVLQEKLKLPAEDFIFFNTRPLGRGYKGRSALAPIWDMLTYLRYLIHSMTYYGIKMGTGVFTAILDGSIGDEIKTKMDRAFADISNRRAFVVDGSVVKDIKFIGPVGSTTDFAEHIIICLKMIAAGTGIPMDILVGSLQGTNMSAETNIKSLFATLNQIQTSMELYIRELIKRMGYSNESYNIEWNVRYAHDEEQQSKINMNKAQTLAIRSAWLTINEVREADGFGPTEGGDKLKSDFNINVAGMQTPDEKEQTRNPEGVNI